MYNKDSDIFREIDEEESILSQDEDTHSEKSNSLHHTEVKLFSIVIPITVILFLITGFTYNTGIESDTYKNDGFVELKKPGSEDQYTNLGFLTSSELEKPVYDTVYTDKDCWLELRVNEQTLYQHWRDGRVEKYPISSGNKYISKAVESRPGLYATFYRNPHHKSTQFNDASLYHFMTFNQGIGFHSLNGTGYYSNLGVRPSSHGCIRMKKEDARKIFNDCPMGTLVLAHKDSYARIVGFAPKGFKKAEYTKEEYKKMLAENLYNVLNGDYYTTKRHYFVVDPKSIPVSGVYVAYDKEIPKHQKLPTPLFTFEVMPDRVKSIDTRSSEILEQEKGINDFNLAGNIVMPEEETDEDKGDDKELVYANNDELVKKFFNNPIGILPYYPPTKKTTDSYDYADDNSSDNGDDSGSDDGSVINTSSTPSSPDGGEEE